MLFTSGVTKVVGVSKTPLSATKVATNHHPWHMIIAVWKKPLQLNLQRLLVSGGADGRFRQYRANPVFMRVSSRFTLQGDAKSMAHSSGQVSHYCSAEFESRFDICTRDRAALKMGVNERFIGFYRGLGTSLR